MDASDRHRFRVLMGLRKDAASCTVPLVLSSVLGSGVITSFGVAAQIRSASYAASFPTVSTETSNDGARSSPLVPQVAL